MQLHPIMYVADQYAERTFYECLGFELHYEGSEFPGFLAVRNGDAIFGLQKASPEHPRYQHGLRWQFEVETTAELDGVIASCAAHGIDYTVEVEQGDEFMVRIVRVRSPGDVEVWIEGPNEA